MSPINGPQNFSGMCRNAVVSFYFLFAKMNNGEPRLQGSPLPLNARSEESLVHDGLLDPPAFLSARCIPSRTSTVVFKTKFHPSLIILWLLSKLNEKCQTKSFQMEENPTTLALMFFLISSITRSYMFLTLAL